MRYKKINLKIEKEFQMTYEKLKKKLIIEKINFSSGNEYQNLFNDYDKGHN